MTPTTLYKENEGKIQQKYFLTIQPPAYWLHHQWRIQTFTWGRGLVIQTLSLEVGGVSKRLFWPFGPQFGVKIREDPSSGSATDHSSGLEILVVASVIVSLRAVFLESVAWHPKNGCEGDYPCKGVILKMDCKESVKIFCTLISACLSSLLFVFLLFDCFVFVIVFVFVENIILIFFFRSTLEWLSNEGHIYSTIDDDHYKSTD